MNKHVLIILFACLSLSGFCQEKDGHHFFELIADIDNFHADFIQTNVYNKQTKILTGSVDFVAPTTLRWHQKQPFEQVILLKDGTTWIYDVDLEQLIKRKTSTQNLLPIGLLNVELLQKPQFLGTKNGLDWYQIKHQDSTTRFGFKGKQLLKIHFANALYQSKIVLKNQRALGNKVLAISVPKGVNIIDYTK